jgi:hypothetical protein
MRWEDERYVRIYTRDTSALAALGWEARALLWEVFRKMDRVGVLALGKHGARGLAALTAMPVDLVERALALLIADGVLVMRGDDLFCPNFMHAQECVKSNSLRQKEKRERAYLKTTLEVSHATHPVSETTQNDTDRHSETLRAVPVLFQEEIDQSDAKRKRKKHDSEYSPGFVEFWRAYPRRTAKEAAWKAWPGDELTKEILEALEWQVKGWTDIAFVKHPASWLNAKCWLDEKSEWTKREETRPEPRTPIQD